MIKTASTLLTVLIGGFHETVGNEQCVMFSFLLYYSLVTFTRHFSAFVSDKIKIMTIIYSFGIIT